jgi:hypothetical protein
MGIAIGIIGLWLIVSPFLRLSAGASFWDYFTVGIVLAVLGFTLVRRSPGRGWFVGIIGVWLFISAFLHPLLGGSALYANDIIFGVIAAICGFTAGKPEQKHQATV